jgi:hypothetical protein
MNYNNTNNLGDLGPVPDSLDGLGFKQLVPGALGNYIGPGWSNGEMQESVEWGDMDPKDELDLAAYFHDSAYAKYKDAYHRAAADRRFAKDTQHLQGVLATVARNAVLYGNHTKDRSTDLAENVGAGAKYGGLEGALAGLVYSGAKGIYEQVRGLHGGYERDDKEIEDYYATDPRKRAGMFAPKAEAVSEPKVKFDKPQQPAESDQKNVNDLNKTQNLRDAKRAFDRARIKQREIEEQPRQTVNDKPLVHTQDEIIVNEPRNFFTRIFKRKKKKNKTVPDNKINEQIEKQRKLFQNYQKLKNDAENSALPASKNLTAKPFGYDARIKRAYSNKRRSQIGR